jgi:putative transposase
VEKVLVDEVGSAPAGADAAQLPERVQVALGELAGAAQEGLLALSVGVGLGVLHELMGEEVDDIVGPRGKHDPDRVAVRHGREAGEVTLGGRRVAVERPRVRTADGSEEARLSTYEHFADRDPLSRVVLERMLAGVSTRRLPRTQEPVGESVEAEARSVSKSAVSREFVARTRENLEALMSRRLDDVRLTVLMVERSVSVKPHPVSSLALSRLAALSLQGGPENQPLQELQLDRMESELADRLVETGMPWNTPAPTFDIPCAIDSWSTSMR